MNSKLIVCEVCRATFLELSKLRLHKYRSHSTEADVLVDGVPTRVFRNGNGVFPCPICPHQKHSSPDSLKRHVKKHFQDQEAKNTAQTNRKKKDNQRCVDSDTDADNNNTVTVALDTEITAPLSTAQEAVEEIHSTRDYDTTVLSAFDALSQPSTDQEKKLLIAKLGDLKPLIYIDHEGKEHSLLAASKVIDSLTLSQEKERQPLFLAVTPKKRNSSGEEV